MHGKRKITPNSSFKLDISIKTFNLKISRCGKAESNAYNSTCKHFVALFIICFNVKSHLPTFAHDSIHVLVHSLSKQSVVYGCKHYALDCIGNCTN
jgi:hypothetical protein